MYGIFIDVILKYSGFYILYNMNKLNSCHMNEIKKQMITEICIFNKNVDSFVWSIQIILKYICIHTFVSQ